MEETSAGSVDFAAVFAHLPAAVLVMDLDLVIVEVNDAYLALLDRRRSDLIGRYVFDAFPPGPETLDADGRSLVELSFRKARDRGETDVMPLHQYDVLDPRTGIVERRFWSLVSAPVRGPDGAVAFVVHRTEDVTDYVRAQEERAAGVAAAAEQAVEAELYIRMQQLRAAREAETVALAALRASESRARAVLDTAVDAIITIDRAGEVESMNRAAELMFGLPAAETIGRSVSALLRAPGLPETANPVLSAVGAGVSQVMLTDGEILGCHRDGRLFPVELAVSDVGVESGLYTAVVRDVSERTRLQAELAHQSLHDPLTGLANRTLLRDRLDHALARLARHPGLVAVLFIDLDGFKVVNDTLGHAAGDALLVATAQRLRLAIRSGDLVARFGGDEFVILCEELTHEDEGHAIAQRIELVVATPLELDGRSVRPRCSVGIITDSGRRSADELIAAADAAMYGVKRSRPGVTDLS